MTEAKPVPIEPVNAAHAAYGTLWCMTTDNPSIKAARQHLLAAIGGQRSEGQRAAIQWAASHVIPPSDQEIAAIDAPPMAAPVVGEPVSLPTSILDIAAERRRQVDVEGYSHKSDDDYELGELGLAAALYALPYEAERGGEKLLSQEDYIGLHIAMDIGCGWHTKPEPDRRRRLVKAGALIAAEIERLDRLAQIKGGA